MNPIAVMQIAALLVAICLATTKPITAALFIAVAVVLGGVKWRNR